MIQSRKQLIMKIITYVLTRPALSQPLRGREDHWHTPLMFAAREVSPSRGPRGGSARMSELPPTTT
jgi:hypothetical protein